MLLQDVVNCRHGRLQAVDVPTYDLYGQFNRGVHFSASMDVHVSQLNQKVECEILLVFLELNQCSVRNNIREILKLQGRWLGPDPQ